MCDNVLIFLGLKVISSYILHDVHVEQRKYNPKQYKEHYNIDCSLYMFMIKLKLILGCNGEQ